LKKSRFPCVFRDLLLGFAGGYRAGFRATFGAARAGFRATFGAARAGFRAAFFACVFEVLIGDQEIAFLSDGFRVPKPATNDMQGEFAFELRLPGGSHGMENTIPRFNPCPLEYLEKLGS